MWTAPMSHPRQSSMSPSVIHEADDDDDDDDNAAAADADNWRNRGVAATGRETGEQWLPSLTAGAVRCGTMRRRRNGHDVAIGSGCGPKDQSFNTTHHAATLQRNGYLPVWHVSREVGEVSLVTCLLTCFVMVHRRRGHFRCDPEWSAYSCFGWPRNSRGGVKQQHANARGARLPSFIGSTPARGANGLRIKVEGGGGQGF